MTNVLVLSGRLGDDPSEIRQAGENTVCDFSLAVSNGKDRDHKDRPATWLKVVCWGRTADNVAKYLRKGRSVVVQGRIEEPETWLDKKTGDARARLKMTANAVDFGSDGDKREADERDEPRRETKREEPKREPARDERREPTKREPAPAQAGGKPLEAYGFDKDVPF